jgi:alpha-D-ribose 1-methylphosphonate 5-triphosphate diphosphatase
MPWPSSITVRDVRVLDPSGRIERAAVVIGSEGAYVTEANAGPALDGLGLLALPGIVDLHGDAFERQLMPRPGVEFCARTALADTDAQLLANGITTAFHGLTVSWEPGLRSIEAARRFLAAYEGIRDRLGCDARVHLRFELFALDTLDEVLGWIEAERVHLLAFNEHTGDIVAKVAKGGIGSFTGRTRLAADAFRALLDSVLERRAEVPHAVERLAATARRAGIPLASHDDASPADRARFHALGCRLCEFPLDLTTARAARNQGDPVILGAPNILRGGSHAGRLGAAVAIEHGLCDALTSDYYYPSLLQAAFRLVEDGKVRLAEAWDLVAAGPARAAGLADRGALERGRRADMILVDDSERGLPRVAATFVDGRLRYAAGSFAATLGRQIERAA